MCGLYAVMSQTPSSSDKQSTTIDEGRLGIAVAAVRMSLKSMDKKRARLRALFLSQILWELHRSWRAAI
jgi:hypothetical protein